MPGATFRWSASSNTISVAEGGAATLSAIKAALPNAPLDLVDVSNRVWLLRANLEVRDGTKLLLHGSSAGGDVNELRLQSVNSYGTGCGCVAAIIADYGTIDIRDTKVLSWDTAVGGPDEDSGANGRAYIEARSRAATNGVPGQMSRMDITNSELCYLGYRSGGAYGVVWRVLGSDTGSNTAVNVMGSLVNSRLHHNYIGAYASGAKGLQWLTNEIHHNEEYGMDLQSESDQGLLQGNNVHHNGNHGIFASVKCRQLTIRGNMCWNNEQAGILMDQDSSDALIEANQCYENGSSGITVAAGFRNIISGNILARNQQAGLRLSLGSADNVVRNNESASNLLYGFYLQVGSGAPLPEDDGRPKRNLFVGNQVQGNLVEPLRVSEGDDNTFVTNAFSGAGTKIRLQRGLRNLLDGNEIPAGMAVRTEGDTNFAALTYIRNQSSLMVELGTASEVVFLDAAGKVYQPDENSVLTEITETASSLPLTVADIGASSTVVARSLWANAGPGPAGIHRLVWTNANSKKWTVLPGSAGQLLSFTLGELIPNSPYSIYKGSSTLIKLDSDGSGMIRFSDTAKTVSSITYTVEYTPGTTPLELQPIMVTNGNAFSLRWFAPTPGFVLQKATNLSSPVWIDIFTNTSAQGWQNYLIEPMPGTSGFFRLRQAAQ